MRQITSLSESRRGTLRACPRKFLLQYILGFEPKHEGMGRIEGSAFSECLEHSDPTMGFKKVFEPLIAEAQSQSEVEELVCKSRTVATLARAYMDQYPTHAATQREVEFDIPILGSYYRNRGRIDGVVNIGDDQWLIEDKLMKMWMESNTAALALNDQVTAYFYAAKQIGMNPVGMKYRVTRKPGIQRRMSRNPETIDQYIERLEGDIDDRPEFYFMEWSLYRSNDLLKEFEEELSLAADYLDNQIERSDAGRPSFPKHTNHCGEFGGCKFLPLCKREPSAQELYTINERIRNEAVPQEQNGEDGPPDGGADQ